MSERCCVCEGTGRIDYGAGPYPCGMCDGSGRTEKSPPAPREE